MKAISISRIENKNVFESIIRHEEVNVCGSNILATVTTDNKCYFSPNHVSQALGIDWPTQYSKIKADPVLSTCVVEIPMQLPGSLQSRKYLMMPIEFLSGWLFTIKKVAPEVQAKLNLYRAEGFLALDSWFRQGLRTHPLVHEEFEVPQTLAEALEFAAQQVREKNALAELNASLTPKAALYDQYMNTDGTLSLTEAGKILGMSGKALSAELRYFHGWLFKRKKGVIPTQSTIDRGWMIAVPVIGAPRWMPKCCGRITKKGLEVLMEEFKVETA